MTKKTIAQEIAEATAAYNPAFRQLDNGDAEVTWPAIVDGIPSSPKAIASAAGIESDMIELRSNDTLHLHIPAAVNRGDEHPESALLTEYLGMHAELTDAINRLSKFVASLPAPTDDDRPPAGVNWAAIGSLRLLANQLREASETTDGMF